jgi:hypothetical protein
LNSIRAFETILLRLSVMLKLSVWFLAIAAGVSLASSYGRAAEVAPAPAFNVMQLVQDEHDLITEMVQRQLAEERDRYSEPRSAITTPVASQGARGARVLGRARHDS